MFVTSRLHGSPTVRLTSGKAFAAMYRFLDCAVSGPMFLRQPEIAERVKRYIEWNSVKAGLAVLPEEFP
jgi:hypothetical protein